MAVEPRAPPLESEEGEENERRERHYDLQASAPRHALGDDSDFVHTTTDAEEDVTAPDDRALLNSNN